MLIRGLKTSTKFPLFPSHEGHKSAHERERANSPTLLRADTIRLLADFLIASANRIRKSADTIRKPTNRTRIFFSKNGRKNQKTHENSRFFKISLDFSCPRKQKCRENFGRKQKGEPFLTFQKKTSCQFFGRFKVSSDKSDGSDKSEILLRGVLVGRVGLVRLVRDPIKLLEPQEAAEHSPLWGRWRGLSSSPAFF